MLGSIFNGIFYVGKGIGNVGKFVQDFAIYLHMRFKTKTGLRILAAIHATQHAIEQMKEQYIQQQQGQGEEKNDFRSFFVGKKPGNS